MRIVLDTNVWISAWFWGGIPSQILILCQEQRVMIFASPALLQEFEKTLSRPKFQKRIKSLNSTVSDVVNKTRELITLCSTISVNVPELRDRDDLIILGTAQASQAEVIITGDRDLLVLKSFNGVPILTPQDFLKNYFT
jgi:putative PIN family toxin of toxin-antitoxin system